MLRQVARAELGGEVPPDAVAEMDRLIESAVQRMAVSGFTEENFALAEENLRRLLRAMPLGAEDMLPRHLERVRAGSFSLCPLWPFC